MKEGKSLVEITSGSNIKITPELIRGHFYSNIKFFKKRGGGARLTETYQHPRYREK